MNKIGKITKKIDLLYPELSYRIIGSAFDVYNQIGSGHKEIYYQKALAKSFKSNGLEFAEQLDIPLKYNDEIIGRRKLDFLVDNKIVIEIKKGDHFSKSNIDQVVQYLKSKNYKLAILINFATRGVMFKRIININ